jgi:tRNA pseudouridine38-40 synthase
MTNWKIVLEYDGTEFSGWQIQPNGRTVQEELEKALRQITGADVRVAGGGRTDAGVHARGQVATFSMVKDLGPEELRRSLNGVLPEDVVVHAASVVDGQFHARFSATARRYAYTIAVGATAIDRRTAWACPYRLDADALHRIAGRVIGEHDFTSFAKIGSDVEHGRCIVTRSEWRTQENRWIYHVQANRFLYGMVRALVGTMVDISRGYRPESDWDAILAAKDRRKAGTAAPVCGLCLMAIEY